MPRLLYQELQQKDSDLARQLDRICEAALEIWEEQYLRPFTAHGKEHIRQVETNLDGLTRPLQEHGKPLEAHEIFVLIAACYLHDIGMQLDRPNAREQHAQYAYELILSSYARMGAEERRVTLPIDDTNAREAIARVARAHWTEFALELDPHDYVFGVERGRLRLLGLLLAMADLLDLSPVRARYFRTIHRLYDPGPVSELHQVKHQWVRGFQIGPADPAVPQRLRFELEWRRDDDVVKEVSQWECWWLCSQWRQISPALRTASGGFVDWHDPWVRVTYRSALGYVPDLSDPAREVLRAERAEQRRINRDGFVQAFKGAVHDRRNCLLTFPVKPDWDGEQIIEWCDSHARNVQNVQVAQLDLPPSKPIEVASAVAILVEQWGGHLPQCDDTEALDRLRVLIRNHGGAALVMIARAEEYDQCREVLEPVLQAVLTSPGDPARISLLLLPSGSMPACPAGFELHSDGQEPLCREDVDAYLFRKCGYNEVERESWLGKMDRIGMLQKPGLVYSYIDAHHEVFA